MSWIQTYSGRHFDPTHPDTEQLCIEDIAHALSLLCRFNGHSREFYSVAEHSVRVSYIVPAEHALWGLLHDAGEAYLSDVPRPVKEWLPQFNEVEDRLLQVIVEHFGLSWPMPASVKVADDTMLVTEFRDLMATIPDGWEERHPPHPDPVVPVPPHEAKALFLARFRELTSES
jgi:hypothetical protein